MRVALAQMRCRLGSVVENCREVSRLSARAADKKCDVVIFPETADTGFEASVIRQHASDAGGEPFHTIAHGAKANGIYVLCGVTERKDGNIYNSLVAFGPEGRLLAIYRKIHLITPPPFNEGLCFSAGDTPVVLEINGMRWGLSICYDLRFPELYRRLALDGAEILVVCAAWPSFRLMHWDLLTRARAIENQAYLLAVDRVGTDGEITFAGKSRIVSPFGELLAEGGGRYRRTGNSGDRFQCHPVLSGKCSGICSAQGGRLRGSSRIEDFCDCLNRAYNTVSLAQPHRKLCRFRPRRHRRFEWRCAGTMSPWR